MVARSPAGAAISRSCRLRAKTLIASSSARSRTVPISSVSRCIRTLIRQVQLTTPLRQLSAGGVIQAQAQVVDNNLLAVALFRRLVKLRVSV